MVLPTCDCFLETVDQVRQLGYIYCALLDVVENTGGASAASTYTSVYDLETVDGSIPAGVLGWSVTAKSGTVTVLGGALAIGDTVRGGGYGNKVSSAAIPYTITAGSAMVGYDTSP